MFTDIEIKMRLVSFPENTSTNLSGKNLFINLNFIVLLINKQSVSAVPVFQLISSNQSPIESKSYINEKQVATIGSFWKQLVVFLVVLTSGILMLK